MSRRAGLAQLNVAAVSESEDVMLQAAGVEQRRCHREAHPISPSWGDSRRRRRECREGLGGTGKLSWAASWRATKVCKHLEQIAISQCEWSSLVAASSLRPSFIHPPSAGSHGLCAAMCCFRMQSVGVENASVASVPPFNSARAPAAMPPAVQFGWWEHSSVSFHFCDSKNRWPRVMSRGG